MHFISKVGLGLFIVALTLFTLSLGLDSYRLNEDTLQVDTSYHREAILEAAEETGMLGKVYGSSFSFSPAFKKVLQEAQRSQQAAADASGIPEGIQEWNYKLGDWKFSQYTLYTTKQSSFGPVSDNPIFFFWVTIGLGILGGILYVLPRFNVIPGIKNDHIYHSPMTRGLSFTPRALFLGLTMLGIILWGYFYLNNFFWPLVTVLITALIIGLVLYYENQRKHEPTRSASPHLTGWLGILTGLYLIAFYVLLYWAPQHITNWMRMMDPISRALNGGGASQWFLYGFLYTVVILVMGIRMFTKYLHNKYQLIRTGSVMFFQAAFAFLIPEILVRLNYPYYDFKNIWPLNYTFFFDYNLNGLIESGGLGIFMLVWGIVLIIVGVPVFTFIYGKRWYCSWVCGCGGLAETLGDPYRQLSDKSLRAWKFERWIIHGVLVFVVVMTGMVLYSYFTGADNILFTNSDTVRGWYGFLIGSAFAGVVGTGFYPLMGNRVWCRFGCPLAAYLGLVQRFRSRFRITTNGGQCISCGNCSTYCEMGIDVRWYAQRGQDIVRASCVGCGVCAAVCPRGVLRLENSTVDIDERATDLRAIHVSKNDIRLLQ